VAKEVAAMQSVAAAAKEASAAVAMEAEAMEVVATAAKEAETSAGMEAVAMEEAAAVEAAMAEAVAVAKGRMQSTRGDVLPIGRPRKLQIGWGRACTRLGLASRVQASPRAPAHPSR